MKIIETTENVRKTAINNLFEASEEFAKHPYNIDTVNDKMNNAAMALHQIGINLETIQSEKDELIEIHIETIKESCLECCDYHSIHDCIYPGCYIYKSAKLLEKHTGKSIEELLK